jgi:hypothetical protein
MSAGVRSAHRSSDHQRAPTDARRQSNVCSRGAPEAGVVVALGGTTVFD